MKLGILGCGYLGQAVALLWKQEGHWLTVTTRQPERLSDLREYANEVHLLTPKSLGSFLAEQEGLLISVAPDASSTYTETYLNTAQTVAQQVAKTSQLKYLLYTSSTSVYGDHKGDWVDETTPIPLEMMDNQARILYQTEQTLLKCASDQLKVCILRLGEIYGPGREISQRLRRMQNRSLPGTGDSYTNLVHLVDIVWALNFALNHSLQGVFNLCSDFHLPRKTFYHQLCQKEQLPPIHWDCALVPPHGGNKRVSNQKIKKAGFRFIYPHYFA